MKTDLHQEHHNVALSLADAADSTPAILRADDPARSETTSRLPLAPLHEKKSPAGLRGSSCTLLALHSEMLCLSVRQPWAWLIVQGWKNIENRTWPTTVRGKILIHASSGMTREEYEAAKLFVSGWAPSLASQIPAPESLERGGIVGEVVILDCVDRHDSEWFCGPYGYVLDEARPLPFQPMRGKLKFFKPEIAHG